MEDNMMAKFGSWAFIVGLIVAVLAGVVITDPSAVKWLMLVLAVLGLVVGVLNVTAKESTAFLVATIALVTSSGALNTISAPLGPDIAKIVGVVVGNIIVFVAPAAVLVAIRAIFALASEE